LIVLRAAFGFSRFAHSSIAAWSISVSFRDPKYWISGVM
jgi:hypothetical protein